MVLIAANSGTIRILTKGRIVSLSEFDCPKTEGKDKIIRDLVEWFELLVKANK